MSIGLILIFGLLALLVIVTALGMLTSRNAIYAAMFLVLNFATVALLYITLGAPFIALVQVSVYAGAIMVLFLFVIMLLGAEELATGQPRRYHMGLSVLLALVFVGEAVLFILLRSGLTLEPLPALSPEFASPAAIGTLLFDQYLLPFESTAILLLVAVIGAVFLTRQERVLRPGMSATTPTSTPISPTETTPIFPPPDQRETESTR